MEVEAVEILEILYHLPIYTGLAVVLVLVEVCTLTRVGSQHPQIHMDLLLLNHMHLPRLIPMASHLNPMGRPNQIPMVPHPSLMVLPRLNHTVPL